ncbi:MAG: hypothetical protein IPJ00_01865 [Saprospirales bacterium]|nr:hypothetical protein [Saprospirales bacterium]
MTNDDYAEMLPAWSDDGSLLPTPPTGSANSAAYRREMDVQSGRVECRQPAVKTSTCSREPTTSIPSFDVAGNLIFYPIAMAIATFIATSRSPGSLPTQGSVDRRQWDHALCTGYHSQSLGSTQSVFYTHFYGGDYRIFSARPEDFLNKEVDPLEVDLTAAQLPALNRQANRIVDTQLAQLDTLPGAESLVFTENKYRPKFRLDFASGGRGRGNYFGPVSGAAGPINLYFSDIPGNQPVVHQPFDEWTAGRHRRLSGLPQSEKQNRVGGELFTLSLLFRYGRRLRRNGYLAGPEWISDPGLPFPAF